uniref:Myrmicitoxin(1)-Pm5a n=1 Tax=Pogonomyrmex maricopa TaxID=144040 RepID=TX5A_POGMA|nr:MYRTX1-Pm5a protein [Pogonomyrmex maricopa]
MKAIIFLFAVLTVVAIIIPIISGEPNAGPLAASIDLKQIMEKVKPDLLKMLDDIKAKIQQG